jgi:hypothetical protein
MPEHAFLARWFLIVGAALAVISLILWFALPISMSFPPYLATALLAVAYGGYCLKSRPPVRSRKPLA